MKKNELSKIKLYLHIENKLVFLEILNLVHMKKTIAIIFYGLALPFLVLENIIYRVQNKRLSLDGTLTTLLFLAELSENKKRLS